MEYGFNILVDLDGMESKKYINFVVREVQKGNKQ